MASVVPVGPASLAEDLTASSSAARRRGMQAGRRRKLNLFRYVAFTIFGLFFLVPLFNMIRFSMQGAKPGEISFSAWGQIMSYPALLGAIEVTLELAVISCAVIVVLLLPTMIWVRLRVPWLSRTVEFLCLLPLTIPAIVLVVGLGPVYNFIQRRTLSTLQLFWIDVILALPYAYRALASGLAAIDVTTLAEAARSLGARWFTVMFRVIVPNMWQALLNAMLLTVALVLGEYTIASLLFYNNLQVELYSISRATPDAGVLFSTSAASLLFAFVLLLIMSFAGRRRSRRLG